MKRIGRRFNFALLHLFCASFLFPGSVMAMPKNVAVVVYSQSSMATQYARIAQARMEQVLTDNGITVLDQKKADELKRGGRNWRIRAH